LYNEKSKKESIWYDIFSKNLHIKLFEKFKRIMIIIINSNWYPWHYYFWNVFFFPPKKSPPWLNMYVFHMNIEVIFLGRHISNKNNNQTLKVHEIIFLFKMYMIFVIIQINTIGIIMKYLKCLTYCSCSIYYSWSNYAYCFQKHCHFVSVSIRIIIKVLDISIFHMSTKVNSLCMYRFKQK